MRDDLEKLYRLVEKTFEIRRVDKTREVLVSVSRSKGYQVSPLTSV